MLRETLVWWVGGVVYDSAIGSRGQRWPCFQVFSGDSSFKLQRLCVSSFYSASIFLARWLQSIHQNFFGIMVVSILFAVSIYEHSSARGR